MQKENLKIDEMNDFMKNNLFIMRDDLLPFSFGGNKARKAKIFFKDILEKGANCVITYGSKSSNHCRIIANYCAKYNLKCEIISPESSEGDINNTYLVNLFGAHITYCRLEDVSVTIENIINKKNQEGYKTYFIPGGGHGNLGTKAYVEAYNEIVDFEKSNNIHFDYIFHASGTGTTQAGLIVGKHINNSNVTIVGISVARNSERGRKVIYDSVKSYMDEYQIKNDIKLEDINFIDKYIIDGYGKYNKEILDTIKEVLINYGIPLDTTYTGKAFWGMKEYIKESRIENKNILFIHTGGTPIFFDKLKEIK